MLKKFLYETNFATSRAQSFEMRDEPVTLYDRPDDSGVFEQTEVFFNITPNVALGGPSFLWQ